jgi:hypothetical protein
MLDIGDSILALTQTVTGAYCKQRRREEREASAAHNRRAALVRSRRVSLIDAVFARMEEAIVATSGGGRIVFPKRNLYYTVRRLIQRDTPEELSKTYFESLVKQWEEARGEISAMYCDSSGYFIEPHTCKRVPLGTREVEAYQIPDWQYGTILYVEKKGFHGLFANARLAERYDVGIMCAEGYSSEAGKLLLARADQCAQMTILCFADADPFGYNIARKLCEAGRVGRQINVIHAGLKLQEALDLGLEPEYFLRNRALPSGLILNDLETEYFEGEETGRYKDGRPEYRCRRVELNDLASDPDRFIAYVERKLEEHGCARKLVPPAQVILQHAEECRGRFLGDAVRKVLEELLSADSLVRQIATGPLQARIPIEGLPGTLQAWAAKLKPEPWGEALQRKIRSQVSAVGDELRAEVLTRLQESMAKVLRRGRK